jgi:DNA polymerase-1
VRQSPEQYAHIIAIDTEFHSPSGEPVQSVHAVVAIDLITGQEWVLGPADLEGMKAPPFPTGPDVLFVAYAAAAEWQAFHCLGWPVPKGDVCDLLFEFRLWMNGKKTPPPPPGVREAQLLNACHQFGVDAHDSAHKSVMQQICIDHKTLPAEHVADVVKYCHDDVRVTAALFGKMRHTFQSWPQVVNRGRFSKVVADLQTRGVPVDTDAVAKLTAGLPQIEREHIANAQAAGFDIFHQGSGEISQELFAKYLAARKLPWARTETEQLKTDRDTFKAIRNTPAYAGFDVVYDVLNVQVASHRFRKLVVGSDGRHRFYPGPFGGSSGRSQPGLNIFTMPKAFRSVIKPAPGMAVASLDWRSQEIGISAALSGDENLMRVFQAADPYLEFAILAKAAPRDATKQTHGKVRAMFKIALLALSYGAGPETIAHNMGRSLVEGREMCRLFRKTFSRFHEWNESLINHGLTVGFLESVCGWQRGCRYDPKSRNGLVNPRSLGNFPVQAAGADVMRAAACVANEQGIRLIATVHDALVIEAPADQINNHADFTARVMRQVCERLLNLPARTDTTIAVAPERYRDEDGQPLWLRVATPLGIEVAE